jgi:hypothetical protein
MRKPFELSEETAQIVRYLREQEKGAVITYDDLSTRVGLALRSNHPRVIYARLMLERDHNQVWICVRPKIGLRRLNDVEIAERLPGFWLNGARSKLTRGSKQADVVEMTALDIDQQTRFSVDCIQRELASESLSKATRRRMEKVARGTSNDLPAFTAVEWAISLSPKLKR